MEWSFISARAFLIVALSISIALILFRTLVVPSLRRTALLRYGKRCPSILLPALPKELDKSMNHLSHSHHRQYTLNLYQLRCTCSRFRHYRGFFPPRDIRRLCRHLRLEMEVHNLLSQLGEVEQRIIQDQVRDRCYQSLTVLGTHLVMGFHPKSDFVRVFTRRKNVDDPDDGPFSGVYDKFVLHVSQELWIFGDAPPGARAIIQAVAQTLHGIQSHTPQHRPHKEEPPLE